MKFYPFLLLWKLISRRICRDAQEIFSRKPIVRLMPTPYKKLYYSIEEVADIFGVNTSKIRFWEKEFEILSPKKSPIVLPYFLVRLPGIVHPRASQLGHLRLKLGNLGLKFSRIAVNVGPLHQLIHQILGRAERTIAQLIDVFE